MMMLNLDQPAALYHLCREDLVLLTLCNIEIAALTETNQWCESAEALLNVHLNKIPDEEVQLSDRENAQLWQNAEVSVGRPTALCPRKEFR